MMYRGGVCKEKVNPMTMNGLLLELFPTRAVGRDTGTAGATGQEPLMLFSCPCPQSRVGWYSRSSGSSVKLWATSGSLGTHGIGQGRNHLPVRDARKLRLTA